MVVVVVVVVVRTQGLGAGSRGSFGVPKHGGHSPRSLRGARGSEVLEWLKVGCQRIPSLPSGPPVKKTLGKGCASCEEEEIGTTKS